MFLAQEETELQAEFSYHADNYGPFSPGLHSEIEDIDNLNNVTGRDLHRFKLFRKAGVNDVTLKSQMDTLRVFIRFCQSVDGCIDGLSESINSPSLGDPDNRGTDVLPRGKAESVLAYYDKYRSGRVEHALFRLLWESG